MKSPMNTNDNVPMEANRRDFQSAKELMAEIVACVSPSDSCVITLSEMIDDTPNWAATFSGMGDDKVQLIVEVIEKLVDSRPLIDWSAEQVQSGTNRRTMYSRT